MQLPLRRALAVAAAVEAAASAEGAAVAVVVVDAGGNRLLVHRMDGAYITAPAIAERKAFAAANFRRSTREMSERLPDREYQMVIAAAEPRVTFLLGGVPLLVRGELLGAVGVSGGSAEQDDRIAAAGAAAL